MRINQLQLSQIKPGLRFKGLKNSEKLGIVVYVDYMNDNAVNYRWDGEKGIGTWFGCECECELLENEEGLPVIDIKLLTKEEKYLQKASEEALLKYFEKSKVKSNNRLFNLKTPTTYQEKIDCIVNQMYLVESEGF